MTSYTNQQIQQCISTLLNSPSANDNDERLLSEIISSGESNLLPYHNALVSLIFRRLSEEVDLAELNEWKLLHVIFRNILLTNIGVELRCTEIRRLILLEAINNPECVRYLQSLVLSIATQCNKNEYVYYSQPDEIEAIEKVWFQLEQAILNNVDWNRVTNLLHISLMYCSPLNLECINKLDLGGLSTKSDDLSAFISLVKTEDMMAVQPKC